MRVDGWPCSGGFTHLPLPSQPPFHQFILEEVMRAKLGRAAKLAAYGREPVAIVNSPFVGMVACCDMRIDLYCSRKRLARNFWAGLEGRVCPPLPGHCPLTVLVSSISWGKPSSNVMMRHALKEDAANSSSSPLRGGISSRLRQQMLVFGPMDEVPDGEANRRARLADVLRGRHRDRPVFVTLPYPTLALERPVNLDERRPIFILAEWAGVGANLSPLGGHNTLGGTGREGAGAARNASRGGPSLSYAPVSAAVRAELRWQLEVSGGMTSGSVGMREGRAFLLRPNRTVADLGRPPSHAKAAHARVAKARHAHATGGSAALGRVPLNARAAWSPQLNLADLADFCLEPPGDTQTRSHFYLSVLSGCIPVIFDGEAHAYGYNSQGLGGAVTFRQRYQPWAWRTSDRPRSDDEYFWFRGLKVDYARFTVAFRVEDVAEASCVRAPAGAKGQWHRRWAARKRTAHVIERLRSIPPEKERALPASP
jgi:hypothetical protein